MFFHCKIAYYTGTGCTEMAAKRLAEEIEARGLSCCLETITIGHPEPRDQHDCFFLLFPLHACNAPKAVYQWIDSLQEVEKIPAVVLSVSGGGEISPNTAGRLSSIKKLEKRGYNVVYEEMLVMPSNWVVATKEPLAVRLLEILPIKIGHVLEDVLSGVHKRTSPGLADRIFSRLGELEKTGARIFGRFIKATADCNGCGVCSENCPSRNIQMCEGRPKFGNDCHACLRCIYGCGKKALNPRICKFIVIKEGFCIKDLEKKVPLAEPIDVNEQAKGYIWSGVKEYLNKPEK